jgi:hypothetical protein
MFFSIMMNIYITGFIALVLCGLVYFMNQVADYQLSDLDGVPFELKRCTTNEQCSSVDVRCACSCGSAINTEFATKFKQDQKNYCKDYTGPICDMFCPQTELECVQELCQAIELAHKNITSH